MVIFVDLDDEAEPPELGAVKHQVPQHWSQIGLGRCISQVNGNDAIAETASERPNPNKNALTEALGCYP
jgi:hypothetical protein